MMFCQFLMFFEKTCTLLGIQGKQFARILPSLLNEKANKIYSRFDIDTCSIVRFCQNRDLERSESEVLSAEISNDEALR